MHSYKYYAEPLITFTNSVNKICVQIPILLKHVSQVPMILHSIDTVPVYID